MINNIAMKCLDLRSAYKDLKHFIFLIKLYINNYVKVIVLENQKGLKKILM